MKHVKITRGTQVYPDRILGELTIEELPAYHFTTLELPWKDNARQESCIPEGTYPLVKRTSGKYHEHFHVQDVPDRDMILIHAGNTPKDTHGCIIIGSALGDIDNDGKMDVISSVRALDKLYAILDDENELTIVTE